MFRFVLPTLLLIATPALAHTGHGTDGFAEGIVHPLGGLDHLLAMVAVGLWAVQMGGRALWLLPLSFIASMVAGGALGSAGIELPALEGGIAASVVLLGLAIAGAARLPLPGAALAVGLFALWHGTAHGAEMPADADALRYALGFVMATALLHAAGIAVADGVRQRRGMVRGLGAAIAATGLWLATA